MYNATTIQNLVDLVGWSPAVPPSDIAVSVPNKTAISLRYYDSFHQAAIVENVDATLTNPDKDSDTLNALLLKMKKDTVLEVLNRIFDTNPLAYSQNQELNGKYVTSINYAVEYDLLIGNRINVFADVIGYNMAVRCLQLFTTSDRSNRLEAIQKMRPDEMKIELYGVFDTYGKLISQGAFHRYESALKRAIEILFPTTTSSKNVLRGKDHVW